jgi:hypothetical protein
MSHAAKCGNHRGQRKLQQHCAHRAAKNDQRCRRLQNLPQVSTFNEQPSHNAGDGQEDSSDAGFIHELLLREQIALARTC